ncbi:glycosyltransferase family 2 protein [Chitinimonas naiadis]
MPAQIDILLATYNGAVWLPALLASLERQTLQDWRLIVRDDGSRDGTVALLEAFQRAHPAQVSLLDGDGVSLGVVQNFAALAAVSEAPYSVFADQDDVWLPGKLAGLLAAMQQRELATGSSTPLLVHHDLIVVDADDEVIAPSFWQLQGLDALRRGSFRALLVQNNVTGCATMINRALRELALPIPAQAIMHDHWFGLVASAFGKVIALPEALVRYRQHGGNQVGASSALVRYRRAIVDGPTALRLRVTRGFEQAAAFQAGYRGRLAAEPTNVLTDYLALPDTPRPWRQWRAIRGGFHKAGLLRDLAFYCFL